MQLFSCSHTHTHTHTNHHHHHHQHDFMCLLNFQVLEAHIVLSECIISRLIPTDFQYSMNPPSSVHICKRDTEKCINLQFKRPSLNSDFFNCTDIMWANDQNKTAAQNTNHNTASHRDAQRPQSDDETILIFSHVPRSSKAK